MNVRGGSRLFKNPYSGLTLVETLVALSVGAIIFLGLLSYLQVTHKSLKQDRELGTFFQTSSRLSHELHGLNSDSNNCLSYFQYGTPMEPSEGPVGAEDRTPLTLLKKQNDPTTATTPALPADQIRFDKAGTQIEGNLYKVFMRPSKRDCYMEPTKSCFGSLMLEMTRPTQTGKKTYFGLPSQSQELARFAYSVDINKRLRGCNLRKAYAGQLNYAACFKSPLPTKGSGQLNPCPPGHLVLGACSAGMTPLVPGPSVPTYCGNNSASEIGCCPLVDPEQVRGTQVRSGGSCNADEVISGTCGFNPGGGNCSTVECSKLQAGVEGVNLVGPNIVARLCYTMTIQKGKMEHCNYRELMTGYDGQSMTCCLLLPPPGWDPWE